MAKMQLGAEPKKVAFLAVLLGAAGYLFYTNVFSGGGETARPAQPRPAAAKALGAAQDVESVTNTFPRGGRAASAAKGAATRGARPDFKPTMRVKEGEGGVELAKVDPTLRLDLLARLENVRIGGANRNLFEFSGAAPAPDAAKPKLPEPKIVPQAKFIGPLPAPPKPAEPVKPPPPPINLKFYGSSLPVGAGVKRVFCLDGDQIFTPTEGEVFKKRYKIVRINTSSVVVEDLEYSNQQTLPIEEAPRSG